MLAAPPNKIDVVSPTKRGRPLKIRRDCDGDDRVDRIDFKFLGNRHGYREPPLSTVATLSMNARDDAGK
jgi:hypothetical protein